MQINGFQQRVAGRGQRPPTLLTVLTGAGDQLGRHKLTQGDLDRGWPNRPAILGERGGELVGGLRAAITGIHANAAGDDRRNLNGEYALVRNTGAAAINLAGWKLSAGDRGQRFSLARYSLKKNATVRIHTGRGTTRAGHLFLGSGRPIWNNNGDSATLIDPSNVAVSRYRY